MATGQRRCYTLFHEGMKFNASSLLNFLTVAEFAGLQHLLDGPEQAVRIGAHIRIEAFTVSLIDRASLQRIEVEPYARDRSFQLVCYGVEKRVLAFVAADFADKKDRVDHHTGDQN